MLISIVFYSERASLWPLPACLPLAGQLARCEDVEKHKQGTEIDFILQGLLNSSTISLSGVEPLVLNNIITSVSQQWPYPRNLHPS